MDYKEKAKGLDRDFKDIKSKTLSLLRQCLIEKGNLFAIEQDDIESIDGDTITLTDDGVQKVLDECDRIEIYTRHDTEKQYLVGLRHEASAPDEFYAYCLDESEPTLQRWPIDYLDTDDLRVLLNLVRYDEPIEF